MDSLQKSEKHVQKLKFEIIPEYLSAPEINEEIRWEDDGGRVPNLAEMIDESQLPIRSGSILKVRAGRVVREGQKVFFVAEIELLQR